MLNDQIWNLNTSMMIVLLETNHAAVINILPLAFRYIYLHFSKFIFSQYSH